MSYRPGHLDRSPAVVYFFSEEFSDTRTKLSVQANGPTIPVIHEYYENNGNELWSSVLMKIFSPNYQKCLITIPTASGFFFLVRYFLL